MAPSGRERAQIRLDYKRLHRAADSRVPKLKAIIASALNAAYNSVSDLDAADAYSQSPESFRRAIDWRTVGRILGAPDSDYTVYKAATAADVFGEIFIDGGKTASGYLSGSLAMTEPLAIAYGEQRAGTLIQGIQAQQLNTVRAAIGTGLSEGVTPQRTGRLLRATTGLSERQGASLVNYERGLTEKMLTGTTGTVLRGAGRPLADQRYSLANLNQQKVDNLVERYRERLVNYRAEMIARTETMRAANMGAFAEQRAQASAGLFDAKTAQRIWQTTPDDRACDECTDLDGQTVGFEQSFVLSADAESNTTGENMSGEVPPLHPMCRCTFYLDVSLESLANAFRDGNFDFGADTRSLDDLLGPRWQEGFKPGAQMQLPTLPQLNYLPPTIPSARGAATIEEAAATPRARRPRTVKPKPQPVEVPAVIEPTPAVTIEPQATATAAKPLDLQQGFKFGDDVARERFSGPLDEMAKIHTLPSEMPTLQASGKPFQTQIDLLKELKGQGNASGVFKPAGTGRIGPQIEIKVARWNPTTGPGRPHEVSTFMHEVGHRVDAIYDVTSGYHTGWYSESGTPATIDFLKAATTESPSFAQGLEHYQAFNKGEYFESGIEVWARAYNQYMAYETESTLPEIAESFRFHARGQLKYYQWDEAEFRANIGPKVRAVLEERGLIVAAQESALVDAATAGATQAEAATTAARVTTAAERRAAEQAIRDARAAGMRAAREARAVEREAEVLSQPARTLSVAQQERITEIDRLLEESRPLVERARQLQEEAFAAKNRRSYRAEEQAYNRLNEVRQSLKPYRGLSEEKMTILFEEVPGFDISAARWAEVPNPVPYDGSVPLPTSGPAVRNPTDIPKFADYRYRYVVADTPTVEMNEALRGTREMTAGLKRRVNEAMKMTTGETTRDSVVSRSMALQVDDAAALRPGTVWESKGFQSTQERYLSSYNRSQEVTGSVNVQVSLRLPKGTPAADLEHFEILLRPGSSRVVSSRWDGQILHVIMEWIG